MSHAWAHEVHSPLGKHCSLPWCKRISRETEEAAICRHRHPSSWVPSNSIRSQLGLLFPKTWASQVSHKHQHNLFFKLILLLAYMFCLYVCVCALGFPRTEIRDSCDCLCGCLELNPCSLEEQAVFFTTEPPLQPVWTQSFFYFFKFYFII